MPVTKMAAYAPGKLTLRIGKWSQQLAENLGSNAGSLEVNPFNQEVYISDQATNKISEIDPGTWTLKKQLQTAKTPDCMKFATVQ